MATKGKATKSKQTERKAERKAERPGVQVVLRVPAEVKALLKQQAHGAMVSMNAAATERLATGRWPKKEEQK